MAIDAHAVRPELEHASGAGGPLGDSRSVQPKFSSLQPYRTAFCFRCRCLYPPVAGRHCSRANDDWHLVWRGHARGPTITALALAGPFGRGLGRACMHISVWAEPCSPKLALGELGWCGRCRDMAARLGCHLMVFRAYRQLWLALWFARHGPRFHDMGLVFQRGRAVWGGAQCGNRAMEVASTANQAAAEVPLIYRYTRCRLQI